MNKQCFLCGSNKFHIIHKGVRDNPSLDVLKCDACGLVRLSEIVTDDTYYVNALMRENDTEEDLSQIRTTARPDDYRRYLFLRRLIENKTLLDFGCGAGGVLQYAQNEAKKVYGVELETTMYKELNKEGIRCFQTLEEAYSEIKGKIDVVTLFHVLEHLKDPIKILKGLKEVLSENGKIVIEVPNANDALLAVYENKCFSDFTYWESHLYLYDNITLKMLMDKAGLKVKFLTQIQRYPLSNTLYWLAKGKPGGHKIWSMLSNEILDREYENQLVKLGIADTLMAVVEVR